MFSRAFVFFSSILLAPVALFGFWLPDIPVNEIKHSTYIKGQIKCGGEPVSNANVTIVSRFGWKQLGGSIPDVHGHFECAGITDEEKWDPVIEINHSCGERVGCEAPDSILVIPNENLCEKDRCLNDSNLTYVIGPFSLDPAIASSEGRCKDFRMVF